jgi:hypothetical protein
MPFTAQSRIVCLRTFNLKPHTDKSIILPTVEFARFSKWMLNSDSGSYPKGTENHKLTMELYSDDFPSENQTRPCHKRSSCSVRTLDILVLLRAFIILPTGFHVLVFWTIAADMSQPCFAWCKVDMRIKFLCKTSRDLTFVMFHKYIWHIITCLQYTCLKPTNNI